MGRQQPLVTSMNERLLVAIGRSIAAVPDSAGHSRHALVRPRRKRNLHATGVLRGLLDRRAATERTRSASI
jgi:hypothetical protein